VYLAIFHSAANIITLQNAKQILKLIVSTSCNGKLFLLQDNVHILVLKDNQKTSVVYEVLKVTTKIKQTIMK
jgi:hypothetical protein